MNHATKQSVVERANERRTGISDAKGPEYAGQADAYQADDQDVLANFKRQAERWDVSSVKVAGVYFGKHVDSVETFVREFDRADAFADRMELVNKGEGILSRLDDLRNYVDLLECLLADENVHPERPLQTSDWDRQLVAAAERMDWTPEDQEGHNVDVFTARELETFPRFGGFPSVSPTFNVLDLDFDFKPAPVSLAGDECDCDSCWEDRRR